MNEVTFFKIFGEVSDAVVAFTRDGTVKYANRAFHEMTGLSLTEIQHPVCGLMPGPEADRDAILKINAGVAQGAACSGEILTHRKSGEPFWIRFSMQPHVSDDGCHSLSICMSYDITSQKEAQGKASKSQSGYQFIFHNVQSAITVHGPDAKIRIANPSAIELLGIQPEDLEGVAPSDPIFRLFRENGSEMPLGEYPVMRAINGRHPVRGVVMGYHRAKDGKLLWLVCSAFPVAEDDGNVAEVLLSFSDITRLIESEAEARTLRKRFELAARATQDAIFEWDIKTGEFWANEAYKTIYGYEPAKYINLENLESSSAVDADHDLVRQTTLDAINSGKERYTLDYEFRRSDGQTGHAVVRGFIVRDAVGDAQRIIGTTTDVGQLTRATAALEQSEKRFRIIADTVSDVLWDRNFDTNVMWVTPDWPERLRVSIDHNVTSDRFFLDHVKPEDGSRVQRSFLEAIKSDAAEWEIQYVLNGSDGTSIDMAVKAAILRHPDGRVYRMLGNARNVTFEKRQQEGYSRARALEAVGQLTGGVAHDFNNLLMIILGNAELLETSNLCDEDAETVLSISQAAESAATMTRRLLTFARQAQLNMTSVDVSGVMVDTLALLKAGLPESLRLNQVVAPGLWSVDADANGLEQAIVNLAMNARDAMPRGGEIVLTCANLDVGEDMVAANADLRPGRYVAISVSDAGEGMPPEVLARAFEPFFTTKDVGKGTGLGLSTVYGFAKQSGGGVAIYSELGHGTTVTLYLPATEGDIAQSVATEREIKPKQSTCARRILVVEDQPQVRAHVDKTLTRLGYDVVTAHDAARALVLLESEEPFDLLFTDVIMPGGMNGQELGEAVSKLAPQLKILYTSGYPAAAFEHLGLKELGSINFLSKPYKSSQLQEKIASMLDI